MGDDNQTAQCRFTPEVSSFLGSYLSAEFLSASAVPQGGILDQFLFVTSVNDLPDVLKLAKMISKSARIDGL